MNIIKTTLLSIIIALLTNCSNTPTSEETSHEQTDTTVEVAAPQKALLTNFTEKDVARFSISAIMGQPSNKIKVQHENGLYYVSYIRKSDSKKFEYKIKIDDNKVVWANIDGRWRDSEYDERISFEEDGNKLKITQSFSDGSSGVNEFKKGD